MSVHETGITQKKEVCTVIHHFKIVAALFVHCSLAFFLRFVCVCCRRNTGTLATRCFSYHTSWFLCAGIVCDRDRRVGDVVVLFYSSLPVQIDFPNIFERNPAESSSNHRHRGADRVDCGLASVVLECSCSVPCLRIPMGR